jgi:CheY-like chemotaxis protein
MHASHRPTALLVDDEPLSRKAEQARLEGEGYAVFAASGSTDALAQARLTAPNVIFVHALTAGGNLPLIQALRSDDACRHIPIVVIRGGTDRRIASTKLKTVPRDGW